MSMPDTLFPLADVSERNRAIGEEQAVENWLARWLLADLLERALWVPCVQDAQFHIESLYRP
jgi:hypothetical protein